VDNKLVGALDEGRMARAIHNLTRNAVEAMSVAWSFTLRRRHGGPDLVIAVSDTGPGIHRKSRGVCFNPSSLRARKAARARARHREEDREEHGGQVSVHSSSRGATSRCASAGTAATTPAVVAAAASARRRGREAHADETPVVKRRRAPRKASARRAAMSEGRTGRSITLRRVRRPCPAAAFAPPAPVATRVLLSYAIVTLAFSLVVGGPSWP